MQGDSGDAIVAWLRAGGADSLDFAMAGAFDVVGVVGRDLVIRYVNWTAPGLTRESVVGMHVMDLAPPEYKQTAQRVYRSVLDTGVGERFEIMYRDADQVLMWEVRVGPVRVDGEVIGLVTFSGDVTEQRRAEADRDRFFQLSLDLLVVATPDGTLRRVSSSFAEVLGYGPTEIVGRRFMDFVHPDDRADTLEAFARVQAGTPVIDFENRYRCQDGQYRVLSWRSNIDPVTGDTYWVARDITAHRATELQLRQAQKMEAVGQLAGGVAHDFNNLMLAILANAELGLTDEPPPPPGLGDRLTDIQMAARRAADLTKQLLAFSRRQPLRPVAVDLNGLAEGLMSMLRRLLPEHIGIALVQAPALASVHADPTQLEQVIVNLCVNARDAMDVGGQLTLGTENLAVQEGDALGLAAGDYVLLRVGDTGAGMTEEVRERIFEPFFTTKAAHAGTGLGLSTAYGIVQQHGGVLRVQSEPGQGTTFSLYLPAHAGRVEPARAQPPSDAPGGCETILLAEDEPAVRAAIVEVLARAGYEVIVAEDGAEALRLLRERPGAVDLALLDVVMPNMGGPETWDQMRVLRPELKVLFCSGYADDRYLKRLPPDAEVLGKPFDGEALLRRIRQRLDA